MSTATTKITVSRRDHGRRMSFADFTTARGAPGCRYELSGGVISVQEIADPPHCDFIDAIRDQLAWYRSRHASEIRRILNAADAKVSIPQMQCERHPDISLYKQDRPGSVTGNDTWSVWIPELVIEVVCPESADRDYNQKPDEYLQFGVQEYWIVDRDRNQMTVHQRSDDAWDVSTVSPGESYRTDLLPGLEFDLKAVFDAVAD